MVVYGLNFRLERCRSWNRSCVRSNKRLWNFTFDGSLL